MNASSKFIVILILSLITSLSYADKRISLLKIIGKVQISSDMKSWVDVKKPQKIENKTWLKTGKSGSVVLVLPDRTQTKVTRNSTLFLEKFGAPVEKLEELVKAKTVTVSKLMEIVPEGTVDPTPSLYNTTMYAMAALLVIAFFSNLLIRPVNSKHHVQNTHPGVLK